ncbi:hypothetical protein NLX71_25110 [Paenibacillus sp. MZ04-78.2]|uniref:hypothetical protein n=1 Tax=Paenibacillus sp. MZ04-78.2 TaxID=2962034 RepID=UPI0020B6CECF|nr:hypothetical protein [Paenibacillus sp. MZ04-78.2]MCP3776528.1 hypothetical protein [Paenibacillus sp. MZ04-78.2]
MQNKGSAPRRGPASFSIDMALYLLGFLGLMYGSILTILVIRIPLSLTTLILANLICASAIALWMYKKGMLRASLPAIITTALLVGVSVLSNAIILDTSFDGQGYHQLASASIRNGWNPLYEPAFASSVWVEHYPKAAWFVAAAFYTYTGIIDTGKSINLIVLFASFFASFAYLHWFLIAREEQSGITMTPMRRFYRWALAVLLAACAAFNPVTMVQLFSHYNDGLIGSLLFVLISSLAYAAVRADRRVIGAAMLSIVFLLNIKFTAVAYAALICLFFIVYVAFTQKGRTEMRRPKAVQLWQELWRKGSRAKRAILTLGATGICAIVLIGFNPYVYNTINKGHPLYPLAGKEKIDIMTENSPADFVDKNRFEKFLRSYTAMTENPLTPEESRPTQFWPIDTKAFFRIEYDTRTAAFGPLTLWLVTGSLLVWLVTLAADRRLGAAGGIAVFALLLTVFINPEAWWARYVPQLWLVPLLIAAIASISRWFPVRAAGLLLLAVALYNAGGVGGIGGGRQIVKSMRVQSQYEHLQAPIEVLPNGFLSIENRLREYGVNYVLITEEKLCKQPTRFIYTLGLYCEGKGEK